MPPTSYTINAIKDSTPKASPISWIETIYISGKPVTFKVDTGSDANLLSNEVFKKIKPKPKLIPSTVKLTSYSGHIINILGASDLKCVKNSKQIVNKFFVTSIDTDNVLGLQASIDLGIVNKISPSVEVHTAEKTVRLFSDVFGAGEVMQCRPYHLSVLANAKPIQSTPRKNPAVVKGRIEAELNRMVDMGVLDHVLDMAWTNPIIILGQADSVKIYLDCRIINKFIVTTHQPMPIEDMLCSIKANCFSVVTIPSGHSQIPLDEESSNFCSFTSMGGGYRFRTLPYGLVGGTKIFHSLAMEIFEGINGVVVYGEDVLIYGINRDEHNARLVEVLERARQFNLKLCKTKLQLAKAQVTFLGHILSKNGMTFDESRVEAIRTIPVPSNKQELQRFLTMVMYFNSIPNLLIHTESLNRPINEGKFYWSKDQDLAFVSLKNTLSEVPLTRTYNSLKPVYISVAASTYGLGAVALQDGHPLGYYSIAFNASQQKYSQIEKKLFAVVYGLDKFHYYTYGKDVVVQSDHRPLLTVLKDPLEMMSSRQQKMMIKLMKYHFKLEYVAGKDLVVAAALSRSPLKDGDVKLAAPIHSLLCSTEERITEFRHSLQEDPTLQTVVTYVKSGWPKYPSWIKGDARKYHSIKDELHFTEDLLFYGNKLVVPDKEKERVMAQIHSTHQSLKACQQKLGYYWPSIIKDVEGFIDNCQVCQRYSLVDQEVTELPWSKLGVNFVNVNKKNYMVVVDYFSKFLIIKSVNVKTVKSLIASLEDTFATHGLPLEINTDDSPPFNMSEWKSFVKVLDIKLSIADPLGSKYCQVSKTLVKKSITDNVSLFMVVLDYNSTPKVNLSSPAELLMGRRLRSTIHKMET